MPNMADYEEDCLSKSRVYRSRRFKEWYKSLRDKDQGVVDTRIDTYIVHGILLKSKSLDARFGLYEFKWDSGLRVYYAYLEDAEGKLMLLLLGGNKNSQPKDISEAKNIISKAITKILERKRRENDRS